MKKTFVLTQFGSPFDWSQQFIDSVQHLEKFGWYWLIFTPNKLESKGNVTVIDMNIGQFNELVAKKTEAKPELFITETGVPSVHITDFIVVWGKIFEDYLKDSDMWGFCGWDMVFGRLDHFLPDELLKECDVWTDDMNTINGCFCMIRNREDLNVLFKEIPDWKAKLEQKPCQRCLGNPDARTHTLYGTDEYGLTEVMKKHPELKYKYPKYYPLHSHDRLEGQIMPKLKVQDDGSLWELHEDVKPPEWIHARKFIGREVLYFHFMKTKCWPKCLIV